MNRKLLAILALTGGIWVSSAHAGLIYSTLPTTLPVDASASWGFAAQSTSEFGDLISINSSVGPLNSAQVLLSNWSYESAYEPLGTSTGYTVPVTLTLYGVGADDTVGAPIVSSTSLVFVPWRAEPNPSPCQSSGVPGNPYKVGGTCYSGAALLASFSFNDVALPSDLIYGLSFNTATAGYSPLGVAGPYDGLNMGWTTDAPSVGTNPFPDTGYLNTTNADTYSDGGTGGTGTFRQDFNYTIFASCPPPNAALACSVGAYSGALALSDVVITPEPGTVALLLIGLAGLGRFRFLKRRLRV